MENKMYAKPQYKCAICGSVYDDLKNRVNCESACIIKQEEEAKKAAELKKKEEQATRHAEVTKLIDDACEALTEYIKLYGEYEYESSEEVEEPDVLKLLHYFMF